ncbi:MAG TPA: CBS domain-containing protein [Gammaproteobacteria bacterium]|nr:CBS domain-containing protein [Gammaproteobacteria bacterium]
MYVHELMSRDVSTCDPETTLDAVAMMMWQRNCGAVPVVDQAGLPIGVVTDRDIAMSAALNQKPLWELRAGDLLNGRPAYTCRAGDNVKSALRAMWAQHVRRLPVVDDNGHLTGILSMDDIIARAERGSRGAPLPELSFDDAMATLKSVAYHH